MGSTVRLSKQFEVNFLIQLSKFNLVNVSQAKVKMQPSAAAQSISAKKALNVFVLLHN